MDIQTLLYYGAGAAILGIPIGIMAGSLWPKKKEATPPQPTATVPVNTPPTKKAQPTYE